MGTRLELQSKLEELLGCRHVYYQSPESVKMEYPAIRYSRSRIDSERADDTAYLKHKRYELIVIQENLTSLSLRSCWNCHTAHSEQAINQITYITIRSFYIFKED